MRISIQMIVFQFFQCILELSNVSSPMTLKNSMGLGDKLDGLSHLLIDDSVQPLKITPNRIIFIFMPN